MPRTHSPIASPDDPRLRGMGKEAIAGADQIARLLSATPDERLDQLVAILRFIEEGRDAVQAARTHGNSSTA